MLSVFWVGSSSAPLLAGSLESSRNKTINQKDYKIKKGITIMEKDMIKISLKEYEGMKETIEILQNPDIMCQILESKSNIRKGKVKEFKY